MLTKKENKILKAIKEDVVEQKQYVKGKRTRKILKVMNNFFSDSFLNMLELELLQIGYYFVLATPYFRKENSYIAFGLDEQEKLRVGVFCKKCNNIINQNILNSRADNMYADLEKIFMLSTQYQDCLCSKS